MSNTAGNVFNLIVKGDTIVKIKRAIDSYDPTASGMLAPVDESYSLTARSPPVCLLVDLAKIQQHKYAITRDAQSHLDCLTLLHRNYGIDMNAPFQRYERRNNGPYGSGLYTELAITATPLSRALVAECGRLIDSDRTIKCVQHLVALGADPRAPFCHITEITEGVDPMYFHTDRLKSYNECNGRSLLYVALIEGQSLPLATELLKLGIRDYMPSLLTEALATPNIKPHQLIEMFSHFYTREEILRISGLDQQGRGPLHYLAINQNPPRRVGHVRDCVRFLGGELGIAQDRDNLNRLPVEYARGYLGHLTETSPLLQRAAAEVMIEELERLPDILQSLNVHTALRGSEFPQEIRDAISARIMGPRGPDMLRRAGQSEMTALKKIRGASLSSPGTL